MTFAISEIVTCKIAGQDIDVHYLIPDRYTHSRMSIWTTAGKFIYVGAVLNLLQMKACIEKWERNNDN